MNALKANRRRQGGAALLVVLILVATMSALAVALVDDQIFAVRRTLNLSAREQAIWHVHGAEDLAMGVLKLHRLQPGGVDAPADEWAKPRTFPIEGGAIAARLEDATTCFNVNGLVDFQEGDHVVMPDAVKMYRALLANLGVDEETRSILAEATVDWLDTDTDERPGGAEDGAYGDAEPPYRAANRPIYEIEELRSVRGYTPRLVSLLAPFLCALPVQEGAVRINANFLRPRHAALLSAMTFDDELQRPAITVDEAARVISNPPPGGYGGPAGDAKSQLAQAIGAVVPNAQGSLNDIVEVKGDSLYYRLTTSIAYYEAYVEASALIRLESSSSASVFTRRLEPAS